MEGIKELLSQAAGFEFGPMRQYHTLKHFAAIDDQFVKTFLHQFRDIHGIEDRLKKNVSKFSREFADNPFTIIDRISKTDTYVVEFSRESGDRIEVGMKFSESSFPGGVGFDSLVSLDDISPVDAGRVFMEDGVQYIHLPGGSLINWRMNLILGRLNGKVEVITFFPGTYAPPLPDNEFQSEEELRQSRQFWKEHAVVTGQGKTG